MTITPTTVTSGTNYGSVIISLDGTLSTNATYDYLPSTPAVYELLSNKDRNFGGENPTYKTNFLNTGAKTLNFSSNNVIMPHNYVCFIYNNKYFTMLFYGGFIRFSERLMVFSLGTFSNDNSTFAG